jgi:hypothetical protein
MVLLIKDEDLFTRRETGITKRKPALKTAGLRPFIKREHTAQSNDCLQFFTEEVPDQGIRKSGANGFDVCGLAKLCCCTSHHWCCMIQQ